MKVCRDCKYFSDDYGYSCYKFTTPNMVSGDSPTYPETNRSNEALCGKDAKGFEPKLSIIKQIRLWWGS